MAYNHPLKMALILWDLSFSLLIWTSDVVCLSMIDNELQNNWGHWYWSDI